MRPLNVFLNRFYAAFSLKLENLKRIVPRVTVSIVGGKLTLSAHLVQFDSEKLLKTTENFRKLLKTCNYC